MARVTQIDMNTGQYRQPQWTPEVSSVSGNVTPTDGNPWCRYQTPVKRPDANRQSVLALQPGQRA